MTTGVVARPERTGWRRTAHLARRAVSVEVENYRSLLRLLFRRPRVPHRAAGLSWHKPDLPILVVITVVSAVEIVAVDLIVHRWAAIRVPLLVLGIWGLVYLLGMLAGMVTRPHAVGPDGIRVGNGTEIDIPLAWDDIHTITRRRCVVQEKRPLVRTGSDGGSSLHLRVQHETNIEVTLHQPVPVRLPNGTESVSTIHLYTDDPAAFMAEARRY